MRASMHKISFYESITCFILFMHGIPIHSLNRHEVNSYEVYRLLKVEQNIDNSVLQYLRCLGSTGPPFLSVSVDPIDLLLSLLRLT